MIFQDNKFRVLQSSLDALWIKQKVITNNIANYETPGFKASRVSFNNVLRQTMENGVLKEKNMLEVDIKKDQSFSSRLDGNNVDIEKEQLEMWDTYAQYTYLSQNASYKSQSIQTMTSGEMIVALYEGLIKQLNIALVYLEEKNIQEVHIALVKSQDIINYLISTLNPEIEISQTILPYYELFNRQITEANFKKEAKIIQDILPLIEEFKQIFVQADRLSRTK